MVTTPAIGAGARGLQNREIAQKAYGLLQRRQSPCDRRIFENRPLDQGAFFFAYGVVDISGQQLVRNFWIS
jgi:hypothetical protein